MSMMAMMFFYFIFANQKKSFKIPNGQPKALNRRPDKKDEKASNGQQSAKGTQKTKYSGQYELNLYQR